MRKQINICYDINRLFSKFKIKKSKKSKKRLRSELNDPNPRELKIRKIYN